MKHPLPEETYIVKIGGKDPVLISTEAAVTGMFEGAISNAATIRAWRVRITPLEELEYVPPGQATLRPKQPDPPPACQVTYSNGPGLEPTPCTYAEGHEGVHSWKEPPMPGTVLPGLHDAAAREDTQ